MVVRLTPADAGFGMIELLVVVAILSVLTIGSTFLMLPADRGLNRTVEMLLADAHQTRHAAMITGVDHAISFTAEGWTVARKSGDAWAEISAQRPDGVTLTSAVSPWVLHAHGQTTALDLEITGDSGSRRCRSGSDRLVDCR